MANVFMSENQTTFHFAKYEFIQLSTVKTSILPAGELSLQAPVVEQEQIHVISTVKL